MDTQNRAEAAQSSAIESDCGELSPSESKAMSSFLKFVNGVIRGNGRPMSERTALKFLISRKFDTQRALQLYQMHEIIRLREGLANIDPNEANLELELNSKKFTILKTRDANDSAIAIFTAKLHTPTKSSSSSKNQQMKKKVHKSTLQSIVFQLDTALEDIKTQRNGIVFVYNMSESDYSNFDYELCQKILNLLKGAYPAKLKKVLIVSPPLWFRAPFHLLRLIVREKLRDRVWLLSMDQLPEHIPPEALTQDLGGTYQHDHQAWVDECNSLYITRSDDLCDPTYAQSLVKSQNSKSNSNFTRLSQEALEAFEGYSQESLSSRANDVGPSKKAKIVSFDYDDRGLPLVEFVELIKSKGLKGLGDEYESIVRNEKTGSFAVSSSAINMRKNRYTNVKCYDHTRVVLEPYDLLEGTSTAVDPMDYINASYVDGYRQPRAYVSTQGPTEQTLNDFWRMIWQTGSRVIVMVTLIMENLTMKCDKYWPSVEDRIIMAGVYTIEYLSREVHDDFVVTQLKLTNNRSEVSRDIWHLQFISWPDFGTPATAAALFKYRECVLKKQLDAIEMMGGGSTYPPIVVHCSAGIGRSGTFVTVDICIQKFETTGLVDVKDVVEKLREQRYSSIQTKDQYVFCYKSVVEYAVSCGLIGNEELENLLDPY